MRYVDVIFPLKLGPLTYSVPDALKGAVAPGVMVEAEVKKTVKKGIVTGPAAAVPKGKLKPLKTVIGDGPALGAPMLRLIQWMAGYYFAREGEVLKTVMPREFFEGVKQRGRGEGPPVAHRPGVVLDEAARSAVKAISAAAGEGRYGTFLLHAPSTRYELSFLLESLREMKNAIIVVPDHAWIKHVAGAVGEAVGEQRLALYHAGLSRGRRSEALRRIREGDADVVLGSRSAVFAPLKQVSFIAVLQEESTAYKEERGVRYGARDMAVMRGYQEGAAVLLSSICPSVESFHNAERGKYTPIEPLAPRLRPKVRVVDMRRSESSISPTLRRAAEAKLGQGEKVMLYINRKGFSMLRCAECGHFETCPRCNVPLVFHKGGRTLRCGYCGRQAAPPDVCPACGGFELKPAGAGMERVEEEVRELGPVGVEKKTKGLLEVIAEAEGGLAVGTKVLTRSAALGGAFSLVGVVNADGYLYLPDFRSAERAWQDLMYAADRVRPGGQVLVQTRRPGSRLFGYLRSFNTRRFYAGELKEREALGYPPYSRMALITIEGDGAPKAVGVSEGGAEVLGPVPAISKQGKKVYKVLIKAPSRAGLKSAVEDMLVTLKNHRARLDVDPVGM
jgi:primosomal protein N' (replication factor Y)